MCHRNYPRILAERLKCTPKKGLCLKNENVSTNNNAKNSK